MPEFGEQETESLSPPTTVHRSIPRISWIDGSEAHSVSIDQAKILGSSSSAGIRIADPGVSRLHAELQVRNEQLWIVDIGSKNGTFVSGLQVDGANLPDGVKIRVGSTELVIEHPTETEEIKLWPSPRFGSLIGQSEKMRELFRHLAKIARSDAEVLLLGETGTGKSVVARAIHEASSRKAHPFVTVDCAALPENLLEAELFGYEKGAFTGATQSNDGQIAAGEGGTVFLDEIGDLPERLQPKLLRLLENKTYKPIGSVEYRNANVRFIAATHRNLAAAVNSGLFREDLFFRICVFQLMVPPLRERQEDIPLLARSFLPTNKEIPTAFLRQLNTRHWRGNIRELRNVIRRYDALGASGAFNTSIHIESDFPPPNQSDSYATARRTALDDFQRRFAERLLDQNEGSVTQAAKAAGISTVYFRKLLRAAPETKK